MWSSTITLQKADETMGFNLGEIVLLVDDDEGIRKSVGAFLQESGYTVIEAQDGADALQMLLSGVKPTFLITDFNMPRMDGGTLIREIVNRRLDIKSVLLFSGIPPDDEQITRLRSEVGKQLPFSFIHKGDRDLIASLTEGIGLLL